MRPAAGTRLGPYEVLALIGEGGMGGVWKARDTRLDRIVAIKVSQQRYNERFEREARAIAGLNHPHICTLFDVGPDYLVMEYLEGRPLRGPLPLDTALQYAAQCADALQAAHSRGVVHRDFKPSNVMVTKAGVKLLDFGLAKVAAHAAAADATATVAEPLTRENAILGTLQYMSPEQLEGKPADSRSDIFAFGLVLYELIAGRPAFAAASQASLIAAILKDDPPPLPALQPVTPTALDRVVRKCLAKDPDARWQSAADLRDELLWIAQAGAPALPEATPVSRRARGIGRLIPVLALVIGLAAGVVWQSWRAPAAKAWAATRLGGPANMLSPRISPDGQLVAFQTLVDRITQLAVMKPDGSSWSILTTERDFGYISDLAWAPDGSKIYYSRYLDQPRGVFSIPALGGEPTLILENAGAGLPLPDGSLLVTKVAGQGDYRLHRFWPESGRIEPLPVFFDRTIDHFPVAAFPGGKEIAFWGVFSTAAHTVGEPGLYALDLASQKARQLGSALARWPSAARPLAITADGKSLVVATLLEDLAQIVEIPRDGSPRQDVLFSLPYISQTSYFSVGRDGALYLDQISRPAAVLHFAPNGLDIEENPLPGQFEAAIASISGGRSIFSIPFGGRIRLVAMARGGEFRPFLQTAEESGSPFGISSGGSIVFRMGKTPNSTIAIASQRDGRILRRLSLNAAEIRSVALSPDAQTLYYASKGSIWSVPVNESAAPRRIVEGDDVTADPAGRFLYVKRLGKAPIELVRVPVEGGEQDVIPVPSEFRLTTDGISPSAVDSGGRVLIEVATPDSFFYSAALYDPASRSTVRIPVRFEGDVWCPSWTSDGRIAAQGARLTSTIWRYHR